jgi:hypothetical protein
VPAEYYNRALPRPDYARYATRLSAAPAPLSVASGAVEEVIWGEESTIGLPRNVALLMSGPSLLETWDDFRLPQFAAVVAVNSAAHKFSCHWWAASDQFHAVALAAGHVRRPLGGFVSTRAWAKRFKHLGLPTVHPPTIYGGAFSALFVRVNPTRDRTTYSSVAAYWQAVQLAAASGGVIEMFGYDASAEPCVMGQKNGHTSARWQDEMIFLRELWDRNTITHGRAPEWMLKYLRRETECCGL